MKKRVEKDIIGYAHPVVNQGSGEAKVVLTLRSFDNTIRCGCRFKYIKPEIEFTYKALTTALNEAIDKEAEMTNGQFVTDERAEKPTIVEYDYDALIAEFQDAVGKLMNQDSQVNAPKVTQIVEKYLGRGKKVAETTRDQAEFIYLIVTEIKEDLM